MKLFYMIRTTALMLGITCLSASALLAQQTKIIKINDFSAVAVSAGIQLFLTQGNTEQARVVADEEVINEVLVEKSGKGIQVHWRDNGNFFRRNNQKRDAKVYISYKYLSSIAASSGSSLETENPLKTDQLEATVSSGASLKIHVLAKNLQVSSSSGATATITGTVANTDVQGSSGSSINAYELSTDYAKATASSGADIRLNVNKGLDATSSSGGSIRYKGSADLKNTSSRSGSVRRVS